MSSDFSNYALYNFFDEMGCRMSLDAALIPRIVDAQEWRTVAER